VLVASIVIHNVCFICYVLYMLSFVPYSEALLYISCNVFSYILVYTYLSVPKLRILCVS